MLLDGQGVLDLLNGAGVLPYLHSGRHFVVYFVDSGCKITKRVTASLWMLEVPNQEALKAGSDGCMERSGVWVGVNYPPRRIRLIKCEEYR